MPVRQYVLDGVTVLPPQPGDEVEALLNGCEAPGVFLDAVPIAAEGAGEVGGGVLEQRGEVGQL